MVTAWLVPVVLVAVAGAAVLGWARGSRAPRAGRWVANSAYVRRLPAFRRRLSVLRTGLAVLAGFLALAAVSASVLVARPVDRDIRSSELATRDIVLCLDVSGSMIEVDTEVVETFLDLVPSFEGERMAMSMWNNTSRTAFPLTDDYPLVESELRAAAEALDVDLLTAIADPDAIERLEAFLAGTVSLDNESSSLVGDGLVTCALQFDDTDAERSRSIILATDNIVVGEPLYSLREAVELATERGIVVHGLYAVDPVNTDPVAAAEFEEVITAYGGLHYEADDPAAVEAIIEDIAARQAVALDAEREVVLTDRPDRVLPLLAVGLAGVLLLGWRLRS